jgi:hypothetical protein
VKQNDLDEYEENAREKQTIHVYKSKAPTPPQPKANRKLPLKPSHMGGKHQVSNSKG